MRRFTFAITSIFLVSLSLNIFISSAQAYYTNMPASVVIGQPDFTSSAAGPTQTLLAGPQDVLVVGSKLIVTDQTANRILIWNQVPTENGAPADVVLGQPDFTSATSNNGGRSASSLNNPTGVTSDGTKLIVADRGNNRVLIWNTIPTVTQTPADVVVGQLNFTLGTSIIPATCISTKGPEDVFTDGTRLFVSDSSNARVLIFNTIPTSNTPTADIVVGQPDCSSSTRNNGGISAKTLSYPHGVHYSNGKLFITDELNDRTLVWNSLPTTNFTAADLVIGQANFSGDDINQGGSPAANTTTAPINVFLSSGMLFEAQQGDQRVFIFKSIPGSNNANADIVLGQPDFASISANYGGISATSLSAPVDVGVYNNKLFIVDQGNKRVLIYNDYSNITTPTLTLNHLIENISDNKIKISGNVILGEYGKYSLNKLQYSVNNQGFTNVSQLSARKQGDTDTIYEFSQELEPWSGFKPKDQWNESLGYSLKLKAVSYNADTQENYLFHFSPFTLESVNQEESQPYFNFIVPVDHIQEIKNNIKNFEVYLDNQKYLTNISPDNINTETGRVYISINTNNISSQPINLPAGEHTVQIKALDNWGHSFESNTLTINFNSPIYSSGGALTNASWFPLQVNSISGVNTGILSSFNPSSIKSSYTTANLNPTIKGIAFAGAQVTLTVVNSANSEETKTFSTTVSPDSTFSLNPTLYPNSLLTISVRDVLGNFTQLPAIYLKQ